MAGRRAKCARPRRAASQYFLREPSFAADLARDAQLARSDLVVDLGAGSGRLTAAASSRVREVIAVELDPYWAQHLRGRWPNVSVVEADAVVAPLPQTPFRVLANIPFDITTPLLRRLFDDPDVPLTRADVIVEWGVALKRALPWPSTMNDVRWRAWYEFTLARRLPRTVFEPAPSIDAGVLVAVRRPRPLVPEEDAARYAAFVARGFRHGLHAAAGRRAPRRVEPRELDAHEWAALYLRHRNSVRALG